MSVVVVGPEDDGTPLDRFLAAHIAELSRRRARMLLEIGAVRVDGVRPAASSPAARAGQVVETLVGGEIERVTLLAPIAAAAPPHYRILHEDDDVCVVDKPAGILTSSLPGSERTSVARELEQRRAGSRIWVVQRLDAPTSGVLVFAKTEAANRTLAGQLERHETEREYIAFFHGNPPWDTRTFDAPLRGRRAVTHVAVVERFADLAARVSCRLETGRTHQIRLHGSRAGHAVCGDPRHGQRVFWDAPRLALHAARLGFVHPRTGERMTFESALPGDLRAFRDQLAAMSVELTSFPSPAPPDARS